MSERKKRNFWIDLENQKKWFENFRLENGLDDYESLYKVTGKMIEVNGGFALHRIYGAFPLPVISSLYPEYDWKPYKFSKKPITMAVKETKDVTPYDRAIAFDRWSGNRKWFFVEENGRPLTAEALRKDINSILLTVGLKPNEYNTHSFRIGKATDMWAQGYSDAQICLAGRWNSKAFKKYIKPQILRLD